MLGAAWTTWGIDQPQPRPEARSYARFRCIVRGFERCTWREQLVEELHEERKDHYKRRRSAVVFWMDYQRMSACCLVAGWEDWIHKASRSGRSTPLAAVVLGFAAFS